MAFDTPQDRQRAFGHGLPRPNFPLPDGELDAKDRALLWASYGSAFPPNEYFISDHVARSLDLLIEEFQEKIRLNDVVTAVVSEHQDVENFASPLLTMRYIDTALGASLDIIGEIVGQAREGRTDTEYRAAIRVRIAINQSSGVPEGVIQALRFFTDATQVRLIEMFPAAFYLFTNGTTIPPLLTSQIKAISPAGVGVTVVYNPGIPFEFDAEGGIPYSEGDGFSETNYLESGVPIGGEFSELAT